MPRPRFQRLTPERQHEIVEVAAQAFAEHGYEGASYNQILEDVGLSKGSAYYTFEGKADLYAEVLRREVQHVVERLPAPPAPSDARSFWCCVRQWLEDAVAFAAEHPRFMALSRGFVVARASGKLQELERELEATLAGWIAEALHLGQRAGAVRTDLDVRLLASLTSAIFGVMDADLLGREPVVQNPFEGVVDLYLDMLQRLLEPRC